VNVTFFIQHVAMNDANSMHVNNRDPKLKHDIKMPDWVDAKVRLASVPRISFNQETKAGKWVA
jgi:hypothetical protein